MANNHLDLAQLWRCPVSWCTVWKGTPQDCINHLRLAHAVPAAVKKTGNLGRWFPPWTVRRQTCTDALEPSNSKGTPQDCINHLRLAHAVPAAVKKTANQGRWFPPWTVRRQTCTDALEPSNSGISTDVLLFSELGHALVHHYRVFQKGTSQVSLRGDYLTRLRTFVTQSAALSRWGQHDVTGHSSPAPDSLCSPRNIRRRDSHEKSPRKQCGTTRRVRSPRVKDVPAVLMSPLAVSDREGGLYGNSC